jgi:RNA polymerase sigma factor (TIGR02999 family)
MSDVTQILSAIEQGDPHAAEQLLPLVYDELRKLAAERMSQEKAGQTLEATALVHEDYIRLVDSSKVQQWNSRGHFFTAAVEAMRRILVDAARRHRASKRGGSYRRMELPELPGSAVEDPRAGLDCDEDVGERTILRSKHCSSAADNDCYRWGLRQQLRARNPESVTWHNHSMDEQGHSQSHDNVG